MEILKADLSIALYGEITDEITRGDNDLVDEKIAIGIGQVYGYLHRYDAELMFSAGDTWKESFFKALCVNLIAWHLISLCNPSVNADVIRQNYDDAVEYFESVQKGSVRPNWPLRPEDPETNIDDAGNVQWSSNNKRSNHF